MCKGSKKMHNSELFFKEDGFLKFSPLLNANVRGPMKSRQEETNNMTRRRERIFRRTFLR